MESIRLSEIKFESNQVAIATFNAEPGNLDIVIRLRNRRQDPTSGTLISEAWQVLEERLAGWAESAQERKLQHYDRP